MIIDNRNKVLSIYALKNIFLLSLLITVSLFLHFNSLQYKSLLFYGLILTGIVVVIILIFQSKYFYLNLSSNHLFIRECSIISIINDNVHFIKALEIPLYCVKGFYIDEGNAKLSIDVSTKKFEHIVAFSIRNVSKTERNKLAKLLNQYIDEKYIC
jgi:magnesium-transporting ATPase (P-type)